MKRIVDTFLVLIICFSLSACGATTPTPSESELKVQAEQEAFDAALTLLEEGQYEKAIEVLSAIDSYKRVAEKLDEANRLKADAEAAAIEAEKAARPRNIIPITTDNWQEFFEIVPIPEYDTFGDLSVTRYFMIPKLEFVDSIAYEDDFIIDFSYKGVGAYAPVEIADNGSVVYGQPFFGGEGNNHTESVLSLSNENLKDITNYVYHNGILPDHGWLMKDFIRDWNGEEQTGVDSGLKWVFSFEKIKGELILYSDTNM